MASDTILRESVKVVRYSNPIGDAHMVTHDGKMLEMFTGFLSEWRAGRWAERYIKAKSK